MKETVTKKIRVYGIVQGVGFRPTVSRHAAAFGVGGTVCNKGPYVEIFAQGSETQVDGFIEALEKRPPRRAAILKINVETEENPMQYDSFEIIESEKTKGEIFVSPDIAICEDCKEELFDPKNRRYLHPFINCTCCGPRLTILDTLPYDRERTSMKEFPMCPECEEEYHNPDTRRYDAQPVCCNECGPEVYLIGRNERGAEAITFTRRVLASGGIAAVKGIGGFHLCCDATNDEAVTRLRKLKKRPAKPFAVMARDTDALRRECDVSEVQEEVLTGHQKPILLLERKESGRIAPSVAPGNPNVGVMLPYAPLQLLLFRYPDGIDVPDCLVMTSGNTSGAPICRDDEDAILELSHLCDCMLSNDRKIRIRADDTVMDYYRGEPYMIRRSRGYAPLPFMVSGNLEGQVLAIGGELKNSFCIGVDGRFYLSPYVGDLEDLRTVKALKETVGRLLGLLEADVTAAVCDMHPRYNSTAIAGEFDLPVLKVQHHYAHILSCMAENDRTEPVIGVSFDGTGYGPDATVWGGEILLADLDGFERIGSIDPFLQIGGDISAKEGWRIAVSMIYGLVHNQEEAAEIIDRLGLCSEAERKVQFVMADKRINAIESTSTGRLFDAVSAILGICPASTFEGEASMALQFAAEAYERQIGEREAWENFETGMRLTLFKEREDRFTMNTGGLVAELVKRRLDGEDAGKLAYFFHAALARQIAVTCVAVREKAVPDTRHGTAFDTVFDTVALSGGVFQNKLLLKLTDECLEREGFSVLRHRMTPPNDGGIALGQAFYAMHRLSSNKD